MKCHLHFFSCKFACLIQCLTLFILDTGKQVLFQTVKTQMKCCIMRHFIRVCTVCQDKNNLQGLKYIKNLEILTCKSLKYKMDKSMYIALFFPTNNTHGQAHKILILITSASSKVSDDLTHMGSLARAFTAGIHKVRM